MKPYSTEVLMSTNCIWSTIYYVPKTAYLRGAGAYQCSTILYLMKNWEEIHIFQELFLDRNS